MIIDKDRTIPGLLRRLERLENIVFQLEKDNAALKKDNVALKKENRGLRKRLSNDGPRKNSRNSSTPPSNDFPGPKKNQSLREASGKKPGGQPGREGKTLTRTDDPDKIVNLIPDYCKSCGTSLSGLPTCGEGARQVVDIPPIKAVWTEYRSHSIQCGCGCRTVADFPQGVDSPVGYGSRIEALIGYFHARQYIPFKRMGEIMGNLFNVDISEGGIHYLLNRFADRTTPFHQAIKERLSKAAVVGTDETGVKVNGKKHWFWTWQSSELTYIAHSHTRGKAAVDIHFPWGFPDATLVHDGWKPQIATIAKHHQTCLPHLLRRLNYLNEKYGDPKWGIGFKELLCHAIELHRDGPQKRYAEERDKLVRRLDTYLKDPPDEQHKDLYTFYQRMCRECEQLFTFLFVSRVPPDNNASERAIRNVKVKQKISGQFKSETAAQNFAKIRSVIDTTSKNGMNVLEALTLIAQLQPNKPY